MNLANIRNKHWIVLAITIFALGAPYCFFGFDVTDYGFNLYEQKQTFESGLAHFFSDLQAPLSSYMGGLIQAISITGKLVEFKLFGLFLFSIAAVLTMMIVETVFTDLTRVEKIKIAFLVFCFSWIAISPLKAGAVLMLSYDTLPIVFSLLLIFLLTKYLVTDKPVCLVLSYFVFVLCFLSKVTLLSAMILFFVVLVISWREKRKSIWMQTGLLFLFMVLTSLYAMQFQKGIALNASYDSQAVINRYMQDIKSLHKINIVLLLLFVVGLWIEGVKKNRRYMSMLMGFVTCLIIVFYSNVFSKSSLHLFIVNCRQTFSYSIVVFCLIMGLWAFFMRKQTSPQLNFVLIASIMLPFFLNLGTNTGLSKMAYGIMLLPPIIYLAFGKHSVRASVFLKICILIGFMAFLRFYTSYYRDGQLANMHSTIDHAKLHGTYTTEKRKSSYDTLLQESAKYASTGDMVLAYDSNPMFYWVTDTVAFQKLAWPSGFSVQQIQEKMPLICKGIENTPKLIVKTLASTRNARWPEKTESVSEEDQQRIQIIDESIMQNCKPEKKWSNGDFEIWVPTVTS